MPDTNNEELDEILDNYSQAVQGLHAGVKPFNERLGGASRYSAEAKKALTRWKDRQVAEAIDRAFIKLTEPEPKSTVLLPPELGATTMQWRQGYKSGMAALAKEISAQLSQTKEEGKQDDE